MSKFFSLSKTQVQKIIFLARSVITKVCLFHSIPQFQKCSVSKKNSFSQIIEKEEIRNVENKQDEADQDEIFRPS